MRRVMVGLLAVGLVAGGCAAPAAAQGFGEVGSVVWVEGTIEEPGNPYVEAIVFVGTGGPTGRHHEQVDCRLFVIEREPPQTTVNAYCEVGRKARGAKAYLRVESRDGDQEYLAGCESKTRKLRRFARFSCAYDDPAVNP